MHAAEPIGGFFELELPRYPFPHADALLLNNGRACMEWVLRARGTRHVHVPYYTCDVVIEPLRKLSIPYSFYRIDERLEPAEPVDPAEDELLIVNNYFGLKDAACRALAARHGERLMVDCSQAWFADPAPGAHSFYTPRKFLGVADGGCLHTPERLDAALEVDSSHGRVSHLFKRIDLGPEAAYADFQRNDAGLSGQEMRWMSPLTRRMLAAVDHQEARRRRCANFALLDAALGASNRFGWPHGEAACPMVYPFWTDRPDLRAKLIENRVFVATYWPNVREWCAPGTLERRLVDEVLPLPIDQRYDAADMERIIELIL